MKFIIHTFEYANFSRSSYKSIHWLFVPVFRGFSLAYKQEHNPRTSFHSEIHFLKSVLSVAHISRSILKFRVHCIARAPPAIRWPSLSSAVQIVSRLLFIRRIIRRRIRELLEVLFDVLFEIQLCASSKYVASDMHAATREANLRVVRGIALITVV